MIYSDPQSINDTEQGPSNRPGERCMNCNETRSYHYGWACELPNGKAPMHEEFSKLKEKEKYLTPSMQANVDITKAQAFSNQTGQSVTVAVQVKKPAPQIVFDIDNASAYKKVSQAFSYPVSKHHAVPEAVKKDPGEDWRAWSHDKPGDCACGIKREQCEFHR